MKIDELLKDTNMTLDEIAELKDMTLQDVKSAASMTGTEMTARDTQILVYDVLGYDGTDVRDICARCSIIMLRPDAGLPEKWGYHQKAVGNICLACMDDIWNKDKKRVIALLKHGCFYCGNSDVRVYFYNSRKAGIEDVYLYRALPICNNCKEIFYEENIIDAIRSFHLSLGDGVYELFPPPYGCVPARDMLLGSLE